MMACERQVNLARVINLAAPGGGLIVLGQTWTGAVIAVLFAVCANLAVATSLIIPDDVPRWLAGLAVGLAAGVHVGAQIRLFWTVRSLRRERAATARHDALRDALLLMRQGRFDPARERISGLSHLMETDLLVAYRYAQVITGCDDPTGAGRAWLRVRGLDRHKIYRQDIEAHRHLWDRPLPGPEPAQTGKPDPI